jgi:hypothetical protein
MGELLDNTVAQEDNDSTQEGTQETQEATETKQDTFSWKDKVGNDLANSPTLQKFDDTPEGLKKAVESHLNLEKLLGHEKVPLPKGADDAEGRARFNKALGVPEKPEMYNLEDPKIPDSMKELTFGKDKFAEIVHKFDLTPAQAKGLWSEYTKLSSNVYASHKTALESKMNDSINALRSEWGDAFASNVELGDMVISKFADDADMGNYLTATLGKTPEGMKFLAKIGKQFSENKVGDFQYKKFAMSPDEASAEIAKIKNDPNHPYINEKASQKEHDAAVNYVNNLISIVQKGQAA